MTAPAALALLPLIILIATSVTVLLTIAFYRHHGTVAAVTLTGLALALAALPLAALVAPRGVTPLLLVDGYALFFLGLIFAAGFFVSLLCYGYLQERRQLPEECYLLLLLAILGAAVLAASRHFAAFFLGLELLSVALFALIGYPVDRRRALEGGIKYLVLSGAASSFMVLGMALIYAESGTLAFAELTGFVVTVEAPSLYLLTGSALLLSGIGFKLSLVPFHLWTPDVYEGAPAPITGFLATVSKGSVFALLLRYWLVTESSHSGSLLLSIGAIAVASMLFGNLLALFQNNLKRLLAYSSIAHFGYLLVALLAGGVLAVEAVSFYLAAYFVTMLGAFGIITLLSHSDREADRLDDYQGLFWQRPWLAGLLTAMLLSLAGIPLTAGFVGKFYVFAAGVEQALWPLLVVLVIGSAVGLFYYLRVVVILFGAVPAGTPAAAANSGNTAGAELAGGIALLILALLLLGLGINPQPLIELIQATAGQAG